MQPPQVSVVIPVWGRDHDLPRLLPPLAEALRPLVRGWEIIVVARVDSGLIEDAIEELGGILARTEDSGYGEILRAGLSIARGDYVITLDPDYWDVVPYIETMWAHRDRGEVLIGSRHTMGASAEMPFLRRSLSRLINLLYRKILALPHRDLSSGFRMYRRRVLEDIGLPRGRGLDVLPEMAAKSFSQGWKIHEVPFRYRGGRPWTRGRMLRLGVGYLATLGRAFGQRNSVRAADYDHRAYDSWIPLQRYWQRRRFRIIFSFVGDADRVLDIGCGSSRIIQSLRYGVGVDLASRKLRWLRAPGRHLVQADATRLPFADGSFDSVICSEVIEHVPRGDVHLEELVRVIRPGGHLILGTPDYGRWRWRAMEWIYGKVFPGGYVKEHINRYTYAELRRSLEEDLGLEVLDCRYVGGSEMIFQARVPVGEDPVATSTVTSAVRQTAPPAERRGFARILDGARSLRPSVQALVALLAYGVVAFVVYALPVVSRFTDAYVGTGRSDSHTFIWSLAWWPHAVASGANPLHTDLLWAPAGVSLVWVTTIPGPSLLLWPVTSTWGPVTSLNVLQVCAPPLAAWSAYLVCRQVTDRFWPSLAGGYFFGFSTYLVNHVPGHPNLILVFPVGLAAYLVIRKIRGTLGPVIFVVSLTAVLILLFSIFAELFATLALFAGLALAGAAAFGAPDLRWAVLRAGGLTVVSFLLAGAALTPFLLEALRELPSEPIRGLEKPSIDLLSFVIPREHALVGGDAFKDFTGERFTAHLSGDGGYLGIPLLLVLGHFAISQWRRRSTWLLLGFGTVVGLAALGPVLRVGGRRVVSLPWSLVEGVPLINNALPGRFTMYLWLTVAVIVALWLAGRPRAWWRWGLVLVAAAAIFPNLQALPYHRDVPRPAFFLNGTYRRFIEPGDIVLVVPYGRRPAYAVDMLWQAETGMSFRLTDGNTGFVPEAFRSRTTRCLRRGHPELVRPSDFAAFIAKHRVESVVVVDGFEKAWDHLLPTLGVVPVEAGGVAVYSLPTPGRLGAKGRPTPDRDEALLSGAHPRSC